MTDSRTNLENSEISEGDVSENHVQHLEEELRLVTHRLLTVQKVANLGFWDWNIETDDLYWSEEIYPIFGLDPKEFGATYEAFLQAVHPDDRDYVQKAVNDAVEHGAPYNIEHRIVQPDGTTLYVNEQGAVTRNASGEPIGMLGTVLNITERKRAEELRLQHEAEYRDLWEAAYDGMIAVNAAGTITQVNASTEKMFGYNREELLGQSIEILVPEDVREIHVQHRHEYNAAPHGRPIGEGRNLHGVRKSGELFAVEISLTPISMRGEQQVLVEIQDVEDRKKLEVQLRQGQRLEAVGRLAGGIAHDLNNVLTAMMGFTEITQMSLEPDHENIDDLEQVMEAGDRGKALITQMLAFSRQQILQPQMLDANSVIQAMSKMVRHLVRDNVEMVLTLAPDLHRVYVDPSQLEQIVMNLVVNASDATDVGDKILVTTRNVDLDEDSLEMQAVDEAGHYVELSISDTGTGMPEEVRTKIFDPFYTTKGEGKGTGLGLSTVYGIVKQSKGSISVQSEPGEGTTFTIHLPVAEKTAHTLEEAPGEHQLSLKNAAVMLVEDDESVRRFIKRSLESRQCTVHDFESAEDALENVQRLGHIDLAITDVVLKGMKGPALEAVLKRQFPDMTIMFISGYAGPALELMNDTSRSTLFLSKPFTQKALLKKVSELVRRGSR